MPKCRVIETVIAGWADELFLNPEREKGLFYVKRNKSGIQLSKMSGKICQKMEFNPLQLGTGGNFFHCILFFICLSLISN